MLFSDTHDYILIILVAAVLVILINLSIRRRKVEAKLKDKNLFLQTLVDSMPSPVFYKDRQGVYRGCNTAFLQMLGKSREEVVGKTVYDISPRELAQIYEKADNDLFREGRVQRYETQVRYADNSIHEVLFTKAVFHDAHNELAGLLGIMVDITERKNAETKLQRAHENLEQTVEERTKELREAEKDSRTKSEFLDTVINSINHGIVVIDANDYTIKLANEAVSDVRCIENPLCFELLHHRTTPCFHDNEDCPLYKVKKTKKPTMTEHSHFDKNGDPFHVEIHTYPVFDDDREVVQLINIIIDITSRKQAEEAMLEAKDMAESANRLMSEFLDTVSHELRTPMTSIHGFTKLTQKTFSDHFSPLASDNAKLKEAADKIEKNLSIVISENERLTNLINDQLDLSKIHSGRIEWRQQEVAPTELIERTVAATSSLIAHSGLEIKAETEADLPGLTGDADRLLQVLINLVSNAVKFTEKGTILCKAENVAEGVRFSIKDTGIGIPEDLREEIFDKFKQIQHDIKGKPAGTGLGLAISKGIVEHHGGRIWVENNPDQGSTFFFTIPVG